MPAGIPMYNQRKTARSEGQPMGGALKRALSMFTVPSSESEAPDSLALFESLSSGLPVSDIRVCVPAVPISCALR
eukprot:CAMPEP_0172163770 /NCGR_PEP_ID=MMETSP1050-20130122/7455_1 /TAXON_ID=233186 /ORGANISM="Cryptomonas curvata, Strain CCAP979/52" /LENGTH=74 /DNA_ID=CAMNT_0012833995 /DNA_START=112 /DNA_END=336 /DNA_ORIENTATION=+